MQNGNPRNRLTLNRFYKICRREMFYNMAKFYVNTAQKNS